MVVDYSIIIPAYNEEKLLPRTIKSLQRAMAAVQLTGEMIIVDNNSDDRTAAVAREHGARVVFEPVNQISRARNAGAREAASGYLIFVDADTTISTELLQSTLAALQSGEVCGGGVVVKMDREVEARVQWFINIWNWMAKRFGLAAGCYLYCLREGFNASGGFSERVYASEEVWLSKQLKIWGRRKNMKFHVITNHFAVSSARKLDWYSSTHVFAFFFLVTLFPALLFSRRFCYPWYRRPQEH